MRIEEFAKEFEQRARARGNARDTLPVADALELMMTFCRGLERTYRLAPTAERRTIPPHAMWR